MWLFGPLVSQKFPMFVNLNPQYNNRGQKTPYIEFSYIVSHTCTNCQTIKVCESNLYSQLGNKMIYFVGKRPFGVSILYMGWDKHYGFQLYQSDPSGNYGGWKATCIGNNSAVRHSPLHDTVNCLLFARVLFSRV